MVVTRHHTPPSDQASSTPRQKSRKGRKRISQGNLMLVPRQAERGVVSLEEKFKAGCIFLHLAILMMLFVDDPT